tara:strand:+ start:573 stop:1304 length:732 start_codon:yes stop_codon:yes gene_type:complete
MKIFKIIKLLILTILSLNLFVFSCSNNTKYDVPANSLQYLGYKYFDGQVKIYLKNYAIDNYLITLNSLSPQEEINENGITELIFLNKRNEDSSLKITNKIDLEDKTISKLLLNPKLNFKQVPLGEKFKLKINDTGYEELTNTTIKLIDIAEDSRCPNPYDNDERSSTPGSCIHNPKTLLHIIIETSKNEIFDNFIYKEQLSDYEFFYGGNYIKILDIEPEILRLNRLIPDSDYEVIFLITPRK